MKIKAGALRYAVPASNVFVYTKTLFALQNTPISDQRHCKWSAIQSAVRRAAEKAWALNPVGVQQLAGYPLTGAPSAVQFLEMLYNAVVRG